MNITYARNIDHCEPTKYAKEVTIKSIESADNSENLNIIKFEESGWQVVSNNDNKYNIGDKVFFIPIDSVLPLELSDKMNITQYLSKSKIQYVKLRGNRSEGIIVNKDIVEPYLPYIMKWEDLPDITMKGEQAKYSTISPNFIKFYKMPNLQNEPNTFYKNENLFLSEKIHGTNSRFGWFKNPETNQYEIHIGSHNCVFKITNTENLYVKTLLPIMQKMLEKDEAKCRDIEFFGEIYGPGIQGGFDYGLANKPNFKVFAICNGDGDYLSIIETKEICEYFDLDIVKFYYTHFNSIEDLVDIAGYDSQYTNKHVKEGIVLRSIDRPNIMAKVLNPKYLEKKNRVERH